MFAFFRRNGSSIACTTCAPFLLISWLAGTGGLQAGAAGSSVPGHAKTASHHVTVPPPSVVVIMISPAAAAVPSRGTTQFTATIRGISSQAVTWTATGGTISSAGLFTAGNTLGDDFAVTAASVADPAKFATVKVAVQPAPIVMVSVHPGSLAPRLAEPGNPQIIENKPNVSQDYRIGSLRVEPAPKLGIVRIRN
jgi:hypothetical protein